MFGKRKTGWYFVKFKESENWSVALYNPEWDDWCFCGSEYSFKSKELYKIGDMVKVPEKYKEG